tara:strand:+ start:1804 stop:2061 length:258 start_codon:yes stop_codon:yes gene_type:complete
MAKDIKFSDDELKQISDIRTAYAEITNRFGQIQLTKYNIQKQEEQAELDFESIKVKEQEVLKGITEKYGPGSLDPNTGVFTPSES